MRYYELATIARAELTDEGYEGLIGKMDGLLKKKRKKAEKGEIVHVDDWGVRKLCYPIEKQPKGRYVFVTLKCLPDTLAEVERNLKLDEAVLRYQTIKLKGVPVFEEAKPEAAKEEVKAEAVKEEVKAEVVKEEVKAEVEAPAVEKSAEKTEAATEEVKPEAKAPVEEKSAEATED